LEGITLEDVTERERNLFTVEISKGLGYEKAYKKCVYNKV
jgi:hypothetical protein